MVKRRPTKKDFTKVKLLVLDFDGVMTDNRVYTDENGKEAVCCSRTDGLGIENLKRAGIKVWVLSRERNKIVKARCKKLRVSFIQGIDEKQKALKRIMKETGISPSRVCYLGNDINDIECIRLAGLGCAVKNSHPSLIKAADYLTKHKGGEGAVREICDLILAKVLKR